MIDDCIRPADAALYRGGNREVAALVNQLFERNWAESPRRAVRFDQPPRAA